MIQRRQTIFLALIVLLSGLFTILNVKISSFDVVIANVKTHVELGVTSVAYISELPTSNGQVISAVNKFGTNTALLISLSLMSILTLVSIFMYRKLAFQKKLLLFNYVVMAVVFFYVYYTHIQLIKTFPEATNAKFEWTRVLLVLFPVFNYLAINHIKKDIELLASVDRLR